MWICTLCRNPEVVLDDCIEGTITRLGTAICTGCFYRAVDGSRVVAPWLRRQVEAAAAAQTGS